jgi:hypothetical protein
MEIEMSKTDRAEFIAEAMIAWMNGYMANPQKVIAEPEVGADNAYFIAVTFWNKFAKEELSGKQEEGPRLFKVGDEVEFELHLNGEAARWDHEDDNGGCGVFTSGIVIQTGEHMFAVKYKENEYWWYWPQPGQEDARYGSPGYLRLVKPVDGRQVYQRQNNARQLQDDLP